MKRRLPLGIQAFAKLRECGFVYVDKTRRIHELVTRSAGPVFLSRPRRFGKSLLCSTLAALFEGRRELFSCLAIAGFDWQWGRRPVIELDLNPGNYHEGANLLNAILCNNLEIAAAKMGLILRGTVPPEKFMNLIIDAERKFGERAAILIDEYDKPLLSTIDDAGLFTTMQNILKGFYGVLKSADEHLGFVLITGVTKFSQVSVFSDLNSLTDISFDPDYCDLCGITQEELETEFKPEIDGILQKTQTARPEYLARLKRFYNGYRFSKKAYTVYNPFGLLNHFYNRGEFNAYWFATGTPAFLIKLIEAQKIDIPGIEKRSFTFAGLQKFNTDDMDCIAVLYQAGYLTIAGYNEQTGEYVLDYPNGEVRSAFANSLLEHYTHAPSRDVDTFTVRLLKAFLEGNIDGAMNELIPFLAAIPYDLTIKQEKYYQTILYLIFRMLGLHCQSEVKIASGRIDTLVETAHYVYCFEFKLDGTADEALRQIDTRDYLLPWYGTDKTLIKVGAAFDHTIRNIAEWKTALEAKAGI